MNPKFQLVSDIFDGGEIVGDLHLARPELAPGSAKWTGKASETALPTNLLFVCPCGCREITVLNVTPRSLANIPNSWGWNADLELPSLLPSIRKTSGCQWHGYLTNGEWVRC